MEEALQRIDVLEDSIHNLSDYILLEQTIEEAVNTMPEMLKQVYLLRSENLSVKEIAGKLGIADQTVKNYISEVLRRLRVKLAKKYPEGYVTYIAILFATLNH
ncbi:MAG: sigma factor-like helix-turn-helix DNA-binding protein [Pedobacter sp.]